MSDDEKCVPQSQRSDSLLGTLLRPVTSEEIGEAIGSPDTRWDEHARRMNLVLERRVAAFRAASTHRDAPSEPANLPTMEHIDALLDRVIEIDGGSLDAWHHLFRETVATLVRAASASASHQRTPEVTDEEWAEIIEFLREDGECSVESFGVRRLDGDDFGLAPEAEQDEPEYFRGRRRIELADKLAAKGSTPAPEDGSQVEGSIEGGTVEPLPDRRHPSDLDSPKPPASLSVSGETTRDESFTQSFDARVWARAFVEYVRRNPSIATSESTMLGWFANALMRGYDEHANRRAGAPSEEVTDVPLGFDWFKCPSCGGRYFGTWGMVEDDRRKWTRHCNDENGVGCQWTGPDNLCMYSESGELYPHPPLDKSTPPTGHRNEGGGE